MKICSVINTALSAILTRVLLRATCCFSADWTAATEGIGEADEKFNPCILPAASRKRAENARNILSNQLLI
jgi:hypothetical protein